MDPQSPISRGACAWRDGGAPTWGGDLCPCAITSKHQRDQPATGLRCRSRVPARPYVRVDARDTRRFELLLGGLGGPSRCCCRHHGVGCWRERPFSCGYVREAMGSPGTRGQLLGRLRVSAQLLGGPCCTQV